MSDDKDTYYEDALKEIHAPIDDKDVEGLDLEVWAYNYNQRRYAVAMGLLCVIIGCASALMGLIALSVGYFIPGLFLCGIGASTTIAGAVVFQKFNR